MFLHLDFLGEENALDDALLVDDEGGAEGAHILASVHALFAPHAEGFDECLVRVGYQGEGQFVLGDELLVRSGTIDAHAHHLVAGLAQLGIVVAQVARFSGASRGAVLRVEVEHQFLACIVAEAYLLAFFVEAQQVGGFGSYGHHGGPLPNLPKGEGI